MRLRQPRIAPLDLDSLDADQEEVLAPFRERGPVLNIFRTLARKPKALKGFLAWGNYVLSKRNSLPERERELAILRTGFNCKSGYEFTQHKRVGINCGLTEEEVERVKQGPDARAGANWTAPSCGPLTNSCPTISSAMRRGPHSPRWAMRGGWIWSFPWGSTRRSR